MPLVGGYLTGMAQVTLGKVAADRRPVLPVLRPLLVLGGFVALWWILMTGSAQAASGPDHDHDLRDTLRSVTSTVHRAAPVTKTPAVRRVSHEARSTVSHVARPALAPVRSIVAATPAAPVVKQATTSVRETTVAIVDVVSAAPSASAVEPATGTLQNALPTRIPPSILNVESSTLTGESPSTPTDRAIPGAQPEFALQVPSSAASTPSITAPAQSLEHPRSPSPQGPFTNPTSSERCPSSSGSGSTTPLPAGFHELSFLVGPSVGADRHPWRLALRSGGPSHLPGCSPD